jgi:CheY-like chemotaxis protein
VKMYLPCADQPRKVDISESDRDIALPGGAETILVVEDDDLVRGTVVHQLEGFGYRVMQAGNGAAALEVLRGSAPIDLLFTDIVMPGGIMGRELAARALDLRGGIRILYTSGYTESRIVDRDAQEKAHALLTKPYTREALARSIRSALDGSP